MAKKLHNLHIRNFRQLQNVAVSELGDVNLFVGGNNAGKSTFLDAIRLLASRGSQSLIEELIVSHGEYQAPNPSDEAEVSNGKAIANLFSGREFPLNDDDGIYVGEIDGTNGIYLDHVILREELEEREVDGETVSTRRVRRIPKISGNFGGALSEAIEIRRTDPAGIFGHGQGRPLLIQLEDFFASRRFARPRSEEQSSTLPTSFVGSKSYRDSLAEAWDEVVLTEGEQYALNALRLIEPETDRVAFVQQMLPRSLRMNDSQEDRVALVKLRNMPIPVPLQSMGDGMTRVLQLVLSAFRARGGILLIDEFENGLHYSVQEQVWKLLFALSQEYNLQIFATTHSSDCVSAFSKVSLEESQDGELIRVERMTENGRSVTSALGEESLSNLIASGIEVR